MSLMPKDQGLYEARREHDACGIGAVVNISGKKDHSIIQYAKEVLLNLHHRGAAGADNVTGDGAGITRGLVQSSINGVLMGRLL